MVERNHEVSLRAFTVTGSDRSRRSRSQSQSRSRASSARRTSEADRHRHLTGDADRLRGRDSESRGTRHGNIDPHHRRQDPDRRHGRSRGWTTAAAKLIATTAGTG